MRKFRFFLYVVLTGIITFLSLTCERTILPVDSSQKIEYLQGNTEARVIFKLFDRYTNSPLSDVTVTMVGADSATSDETGTVVFDSVLVGSYLISCTKDGYEGSMDNFTLLVDSNSTTVPVVNQSTDVLYMARKGVVMRGNIYYMVGSRTYPADGAVVECRLSNPSIGFQKPLRVTTSEDGKYEFKDLPEYSTMNIMVQPLIMESSNFKQVGIITLSARSRSDTIRAEDMVLEKFSDGHFIVLNHNLELLQKDDSIVIAFSEKVDTEELTVDSIFIGMGPSVTRILTKNIWKDDNRTLKITPYDGTWDNSQSYTLHMGLLRSTGDKPFDNASFVSYIFSTVSTGNLGTVKDLHYMIGTNDTLKADYNTSSVRLVWAPLKNATSYQIFQKDASDSAWILFGTVADTSRLVTVNGMLTLGDKVQFIVLGKNSSTVSSFEDAKVLTVKDERKPVVYTTSLLSTYGFNNTTTNPDTIIYSVTSTYLHEPMDTTTAPTVSVKEGGYVTGTTLYGDTTYTIDPENCFWEWQTTQSGRLNIVVDAEKNGSYDSLRVDFSSVTDVAGNEVDTNNDRGYLRLYTRP